ncbi:MAG: hypothetical protein V2B19_04740 [Pseudomonadota bacterium]
MIIVPARQGHFWEARQELAVAQTACRAYKNALAWPALHMWVAETMIKAERCDIALFEMNENKPAMVRPPKVLLNGVLSGACFLYMIALYWYVMGDMVFWRDEALPLMIAKGNASLADLFHTLGYEGTPGLWHFLLWVTNEATPLLPVHAKAIHFVFFGASVFIVLFLYRVPTVFKLSYIFSYPLITQYAFEVRQYQLAATLILLFFFLYAQEDPDRNSHPHWVLFFLAQTCVHGVILAILLFFFLAAHRYGRDKSLWRPSYFIGVAGVILAVLQLLPPPDLMPGVAMWDLTFSMGKLARIAWRLAHDALFPKPIFGIRLAVLFVILFRCGYLSKNPSNRLFWICLTAAGVAFFLIGYGKFSGYRHHGLLSVTLLSYFLAVVQKNPPQPRRRRLISIILIPFILSGVFEFTSNAFHHHDRPRSHGQHVAEYLDQRFPTTPILSKTEIFEAPVRLYRRSPVPVYALGRMAYVNYTVWNHTSVDFRVNPKAESFYWSDVMENLVETPEKILQENPILVISGRLTLDEMNDSKIANLREIKVNEKINLVALESAILGEKFQPLKDKILAKTENYFSRSRFSKK